MKGPQSLPRRSVEEGTRFGRLVVVAPAVGAASLVGVRCDCGVEKQVKLGDLLYGNGTRSCGCLRREDRLVGRRETHGMSGTPEYRAWANIKLRIFHPHCHAYPDYGGRGLTMQPEWVASFEAFYAEIGPRPEPQFSIDRIDNDLGYVRGNVRWATPLEQSNNRRPNRGWRAA